MRIVVLVVFLSTLCGAANGQDVLKRLEQLEVEAQVLNSPSCVLFDATLVESSEFKKLASQTQSVGRRVVWAKGEVRVDVRITKVDLISGSETTVFYHFIEFGPANYLFAVRPLGGQITVADLEKDTKDGFVPSAPHGFSNPFLVAYGGDVDFKNRSSDFVKMSVVDGLENTVKPANDLKAKFIRTFKFSDTMPWAITSSKQAINPSQFDFKRMIKEFGKHTDAHLPNWADVKNPAEHVKKWNLMGSTTVEWSTLDKAATVPSRILCKFDGIPSVDDKKKDFEVHYFGYDFDIKSMEKLFDRKRFNDANIAEDFPIESIVKQAEAAKKAFENKAAKKSGRR